ncbi:Voltage-dependent calcium channel beta subunit-associated regulatory protein [Merluccius polli]|uniref:Voltage-dependent calcium channel beta subunit-associated regulatory protein n=1 Tax=Merluccius polli TaxID=89951 RepID=A0AA47MTP3_MERPO|nr:Voltage-dependent calcium channel beta subunit-associated regulatory protein [Merluccius polli]
MHRIGLQEGLTHPDAERAEVFFFFRFRAFSRQEVPVPAGGGVENYVLVLVLLGVFVGGTLVLLSLLLLFCHTCCMGGRRYSRASDDPEKTNTTYVEDSQPTQEITIRLDESDAFSASSCQDGETERFVSTCSTGRRVSFNESALYEQERKTEDKGRRYTLTEGDFHHLKKARLTHLHLAPVHTAMKILTITECDSTESSVVNINEMPAARLPLAIYQPPERGEALGWVGQALSGGLPGDPHHSVILERSNRQIASAAKLQHTRSLKVEAIGDRAEEDHERGTREEREVSPAQTSVLQFFSKLRRHASLEGAGPYFRKWKFDSSHRAASLDAKGSPKRRPFQRQRAASETTDHTEDDSSSLCDVTPPLPPPPHLQSGGLQSLSAESLTEASTPFSSSAFLDRLEVEVGINITGSNIDFPLTNNHYAQRQQRGTGEGAEVGSAVETETEVDSMFAVASRGREARAQLAPGDNGVEEEEEEDDDLFEEHDESGIRGNVETASQSNTVTGVNSCDVTSDAKKDQTPEAEVGAEEVLGAEARRRTDSGSSLSFLLHQDSTELPHSLYRDIWSLRASLEQYASSDQSSTDRESIRSDADSVSSLGAAGARPGLDSCLSQDLGDEPEADGEGEGYGGAAARGAFGGDGDAASGTGGGGDSEAGNRKLLQMDSGYASIEAPSRAPEDLRLFGMPGGSRGKTASERRLFFTSSGRKGSVCESFEAKVFQEEQEDDIVDHTDTDKKLMVAATTGSQSLTLKPPSQLGKVTYGQSPLEFLHLQSQPTSPLVKPHHPAIPQPSPTHRPRLCRRDYSIDEKTDALFSEFLRHDPRFDQQDSPPRSRHRSRVHLRKQWQRHKQYSDPGSGTGGRYSPSLERQRFTPLRRGDSAGYPLDTRYHSTLSRIASAADEEATEVAACEEAIQDDKEEDKGSADERDSGKAVESVSNAGSNAGAPSAATVYRVGEGNDTEGETVANECTSSRLQDTLHTQASYMDPRVGNQNNNSSQAIKSHYPSPEKRRPGTLSTDVTFADPADPHAAVQPRSPLMPILRGQSSLTDKLAASVEERLYSGLRNAEPGHLGPGESPHMIAVLHVSSPDKSP